MNLIMTHQRTILIGPLPPPYNGQNMAFGMAVQLFEERNLPHVVVNIADRTYTRADGQFTWSRVYEIVRSIFHFIKYVSKKNQTVYLTNAQTMVGFLRDSIFIWLARLWGHCIILHLHGGGYQNFFQAQSTQMQSLIITTLRQAHTLIVEGDHLRKQYEFLPAPMPSIKVVHNPPAKDVVARNTPISVRSSTAPLHVLYLSNLIDSKGYSDVLTAVQILHEQGISVHADFCGAFLKASDSPADFDPTKAEAQFRQKVIANKLDSIVTFHGVVKGEQKKQLLRDAHVFILPSYYVNEGQPVSIIEAMANGLVIIATAYRGIVDLVEEEVNGFFVPPQDPASIAEWLKVLYEDPELCAQMGNASIAKFRRSFDHSVREQKLLDAIFSGDAS